MLVLGIETSCDETSVALVENGSKILGVKTFSQIRSHEKFGGVVPEIASRIHVRVINRLMELLLTETGISLHDVDMIAVTSRPGLIGSLLVGVSYANSLAFAIDKPVVGVHHLEAHMYAALMDESQPEIVFPSLALVVSGGHTQLIKVNKIGSYEMIGSTLDDAAGEAFDKTAKILNLPYPGGPVIDRLASLGDPKAFNFPRAMIHDKNRFDFSFSGLKTSVLYTVKGVGKKASKLELTEENVNNICASFQRAVVDVLTAKTFQAAKVHNVKSVIVCGGVAANSELKNIIMEKGIKNNIPVSIPAIQYCTDNAVMIAGLAYHKQNMAGKYVEEVLSSQPL